MYTTKEQSYITLDVVGHSSPFCVNSHCRSSVFSSYIGDVLMAVVELEKGRTVVNEQEMQLSLF